MNMTHEIEKHGKRMRKIGEGLGYYRIAKFLHDRATKALRQAERDFAAVERANLKAEKLLGLTPREDTKGARPRKLVELIKEAQRRG